MANQWQPKGWVAVIIAFITQPFVFLYVNKLRYFWGYLILLLLLFIFQHVLIPTASADSWYKSEYLWAAVLLIFPIHAYALTKSYDVNRLRPWYASGWGSMLCFALVFIFLVIIKVFYIEQFTIPSKSMSPTLKLGNNILVTKRGFGNYRYLGILLKRTIPTEHPARGEMIVFQRPEQPRVQYVKRVIGLPGDKITYKNKNIHHKRLFSG